MVIFVNYLSHKSKFKNGACKIVFLCQFQVSCVSVEERSSIISKIVQFEMMPRKLGSLRSLCFDSKKSHKQCTKVSSFHSSILLASNNFIAVNQFPSVSSGLILSHSLFLIAYSGTNLFLLRRFICLHQEHFRQDAFSLEHTVLQVSFYQYIFLTTNTI